MGLRLAYEGSWRGARIRVEAESVSELAKALRELEEDDSPPTGGNQIRNIAERQGEHPQIPGNVGCADAIRLLLSSDWGRQEARTEAELSAAMRANALHYPHGTISGLLTSLTRRSELRRVGKKAGSYAYVISQTKQ